MIRLLVKFKDRTIKELSLDRLDTLTIGRKSTNDLVIDNYAVSCEHAVITKVRNYFQITDQNSKNGTFLLNKSLVTIGTSHLCDIVIKGFFSFLAGDPAATISKTHQHHNINAFGGWIRPKVNGRVLRRPVRLKKMDIIKIGSVVLQYESDSHENL